MSDLVFSSDLFRGQTRGEQPQDVVDGQACASDDGLSDHDLGIGRDALEEFFFFHSLRISDSILASELPSGVLACPAPANCSGALFTLAGVNWAATNPPFTVTLTDEMPSTGQSQPSWVVGVGAAMV
jgi:hypothetical protein